VITGLDPEPLAYILNHLRKWDQEEIEAVRGTIYPAAMAIGLIERAASLGGWLFWDRDTGAPVAALGAYAMTPTCAGCWAFGTVAWPVKEVTRHIRDTMIPKLLEAGFHRAECRALYSRMDTRRWLTALGWKAEAVLSGFGVRREDFVLFAWTSHEPTDHPGRAEEENHIPVC
jgi:hypothetical protein